MIDIVGIAPSLVRDDEGIWCAPARVAVSYPDDGHAECFAVEERSFWFQHRNRCIAALVGRFPPPGGGPVFDIGGGNGFVARGLADAGFGVVLVEPGREGARNARRRGLEQVICATSHAAGFAPASLPAIGLFDVIEHIEDDQSFVCDMSALLQRQGRLYATVPAHRWLWSEEDDLAGHHHRYSLNRFCQLLQRAGLEVEFASYYFSLLPLPIAMMRALPYRLGWRKRGKAADRGQREHATGGGVASRALTALLDREGRRLGAGKPMAYGASCLVVARLNSEPFNPTPGT